MKEVFSVSFILRFLGFSKTFDMIKTINFDDKIVLVSRHYTIFHNTAGENNIGAPKMINNFNAQSNYSIFQNINSNIGLFLQQKMLLLSNSLPHFLSRFYTLVHGLFSTFEKRSKEMILNMRQKKMKIDNFTWSKREKLNISFAILEKLTILQHQSIPHFGCTKVIFVDWIIISVQYLY